MARKKNVTALRVSRSFYVNRQAYRKGALFASNDPIVKGRECWFEPAPVPVVEQATAAPGEKRNVTPPKKADIDANVSEDEPETLTLDDVSKLVAKSKSDSL